MVIFNDIVIFNLNFFFYDSFSLILLREIDIFS